MMHTQGRAVVYTTSVFARDARLTCTPEMRSSNWPSWGVCARIKPANLLRSGSWDPAVVSAGRA